MRLEPLLIFRNSITDVQEIGDGPFGIRRTYIVGAGTFEGERLRGEILPGGGVLVGQGHPGVLGVVGAGGLGQLLAFHMGLFHMGKTATILGAMLLLVAAVDALSYGVRRVLRR